MFSGFWGSLSRAKDGSPNPGGTAQYVLDDKGGGLMSFYSAVFFLPVLVSPVLRLAGCAAALSDPQYL